MRQEASRRLQRQPRAQQDKKALETESAVRASELSRQHQDDARVSEMHEIRQGAEGDLICP